MFLRIFFINNFGGDAYMRPHTKYDAGLRYFEKSIEASRW